MDEFVIDVVERDVRVEEYIEAVWRKEQDWGCGKMAVPSVQFVRVVVVRERRRPVGREGILSYEV